MTDRTSYFIKDNLFNVSTLIAVLGFIIYQSQWQQKVDNKLVQFDEHTKDRIIHPTIESRINLFVPRVELDGRLRSMEKTLNEIKTDVKKNLK